MPESPVVMSRVAHSDAGGVMVNGFAGVPPGPTEICARRLVVDSSMANSADEAKSLPALEISVLQLRNFFISEAMILLSLRQHSDSRSVWVCNGDV